MTDPGRFLPARGSIGEGTRGVAGDAAGDEPRPSRLLRAFSRRCADGTALSCPAWRRTLMKRTPRTSMVGGAVLGAVMALGGTAGAQISPGTTPGMQLPANPSTPSPSGPVS